MTFSPLPDDFSERGDWLVQALDPRARLARLVRMDEEAYRRASFLDDRMLGEAAESRLCSLDEAVVAAARIDADSASWIFHIGHVGSTLVSRLLGELGGVLSLREPRSLRDLGVADEGERPALALALRKLMGRGLEPAQRVVVKATSFVSETAPLLVAPGAAAAFLFATPRRYIEGILAGKNSVKELRALADERALRLRRRGIELRGLAQSDAHLAAAAWACEMTSLGAAAEALPGSKILWADFERILDDMGNALALIADHFGIEGAPDTITAVAAGPLMLRYSKAPEYDYSPSLRAQLLAEAGRKHRADIDAAMVALESLAVDFPLVARAVRRAGGGS